MTANLCSIYLYLLCQIHQDDAARSTLHDWDSCGSMREVPDCISAQSKFEEKPGCAVAGGSLRGGGRPFVHDRPCRTETLAMDDAHGGQ